MTIKSIFIFVVSSLLLHAIWTCLFTWTICKGYELNKDKYSSRFDFCCVELDSVFWRLRKRLRLARYYNSKLFVIFRILKALVLVLLSIAIIIFYFWLKGTEYGVLLDVKM